MVQALLLMLAASLVANVAALVPFVIWFRALMRVGRGRKTTAEAFGHLFGHLPALRGQAVLFHPDGAVSVHDAAAVVHELARAAKARDGDHQGDDDGHGGGLPA